MVEVNNSILNREARVKEIEAQVNNYKSELDRQKSNLREYQSLLQESKDRLIDLLAQLTEEIKDTPTQAQAIDISTTYASREG